MTQPSDDTRRQSSEPLLGPRDARLQEDQDLFEAGDLTDQPSDLRPVIRRLCISRFLSSWNSRLFEFGSVLFLASIYPDSLMPVSVYALVRAAAAITLSPAVGLWIDKGRRLTVVRTSIIGERVGIAISCCIFLVLEARRNNPSWIDALLFGVIVVMAAVEKLSAVMNRVSLTRDWVVEITDGREADRRNLNAEVRRIDLICKLLSPFLIASIDQFSTVVAIWATLIMNLVSVFTEYVCIESVYKLVPSLHKPRHKAPIPGQNEYSPIRDEDAEPEEVPKVGFWRRTTAMLHRIFPVTSIALYVKHSAFLPSFSYAFLHFTVLSFSGRMIAFLVASGYSSFNVGAARTVSTVAELSATWISPVVMARLGSRRSGAVSISWQAVWLTFGVACFLLNGRTDTLALTGLIGGVVLSRIGLWGFDLAVQIIIQDKVESSNRGSFSTVETSVHNMFELLSYASTIIFARPDEFQWPVMMTMVSMYLGCITYALYVCKTRD